MPAVVAVAGGGCTAAVVVAATITYLNSIAMLEPSLTTPKQKVLNISCLFYVYQTCVLHIR